MSDKNAAFVGSIPENYDRYLGPMLFAPFAEDLAQRLKLPENSRLLELACGTGIVTRRLREALPESVRITATDLNEAMIQYAGQQIIGKDHLEWRQADATQLPFSDNAFDAVACQFGWMFFPDKALAMREAHRVLKEDGKFLFSVWDRLSENPLTQLAQQFITEIFPDDPPKFYEIPFGFYDPDEITTMLTEAGFREIHIQLLNKPCVSVSALDAAKGLVEGNPILGAIQERGTVSIAEVEAALAAKIGSRFGDKPVQTTMQALLFACAR
jgi:ubiquinone/menaquinone biosynthesis C-methylase UbiE